MRNFDVPDQWVLSPFDPTNTFAKDLIDKYRDYDSGTFEDRLNRALVRAYDNDIKMVGTAFIKRDPL